jgi:hypothetical protein
MKTILSAIITFLLPVSAILAQDVYINPADPAFRAKYAGLEFGENFSRLAVSDSEKNYYLVDLTKFESRFEKVYFMNLVFRSDKVVCMDSDLSQDRIWFSARTEVQEAKITDYFLELKKKCADAASAFSEDEKTQWLNKNDKYK